MLIFQDSFKFFNAQELSPAFQASFYHKYFTSWILEFISDFLSFFLLKKDCIFLLGFYDLKIKLPSLLAICLNI